MNLIKVIVFSGLCWCSLGLNAQLLPNNTQLSTQSVERWMQSSRAMAEVIQALDGMTSSAEALAVFDALSASEQDAKISVYLQQRNLLETAQAVTQQYGWKSVGEYMRLGSKLGNAIAAYFLLDDLDNLTEDQAKALREKADPAVLAVSKADVAFVKANEKPLQQYIKAYAAGR